jgi:hypothetical protein
VRIPDPRRVISSSCDCIDRAGTTACVVDSVLLAAWWVCVRVCLPCLSPECIAAAGPTLRDIPPGTVSNGVCYLRALMAEDWPRRRHRRSCPCPVGTTPGTLHARAIRSSGSAVEYSHKVTLSERSQAELGVLTWVLIRVLTLVALSEYSHGFSLLCALRWGSQTTQIGVFIVFTLRYANCSQGTLSLLDISERRAHKGYARYWSTQEYSQGHFEYHAGTGALTWALLVLTDGTLRTHMDTVNVKTSEKVLRVLSCSTTGTRMGVLWTPA